MKKIYLGDSVYAEAGDGRLTLTTDNGDGASNTIVLEPEVYAALVGFVAGRRAQSAEPEPKSMDEPIRQDSERHEAEEARERNR